MIRRKSRQSHRLKGPELFYRGNVMSRKFILILLDGLGDRAHPGFEGKTPLQAAATPFLDSLAGRGSNGLFHASLQGQALPSENAHFAMFGYAPDEFPGRGALEALGAGISLGLDDVAVLCHFASLQEENGLLRLVQDKVEADPLQCAELFNLAGTYECQDIRVEPVQIRGLFGVLVLKGRVSRFITDCNPILDGEIMPKVRPWADYTSDPASIASAEVMNRYLARVFKILNNSDLNNARRRQGLGAVNGMVTQRAGRLKQVQPFSSRFGLKGATVSSGVVYAGLCRYLGLDVISMPDDKDPGREISQRVARAVSLLEDYDFIHIHSKAPDEAGHKKNPVLKKEAVERLDQGLEKALSGLLQRDDIILAVTSDHSTPSMGSMVHSGEPVPLTICGQGVRVDKVREFNETAAAAGALGFVRGREFMYMVLNYLDRGKLAGLMDTPVDQPFWPGQSEPLRLV